MADVPDRLNQSLHLSLRRRTYESVKVVALYWEDGHQGYKNEGKAVVETFKASFQYSTEEFAIPSTHSYAHVLGLMTRVLLEIGTTTEKTKAASLLIVHYGGHGDRDDDRHQGQEKRSVWAAARQTFGGRFEILAASAMGMETPAPGDTSFTAILLKEITSQLQTKDSIVSRPIRLEPLSQPSQSSVIKDHPEMDSSFLHLLVEIDGELGALHIDEIARWLGADTPRIVSKLVFQTTAQISMAINKMEKESDNISSRLDTVSKQEIETAWHKVVDLVERYYATQHGRSNMPYLNNINEKAREFLRQLDFCNNSVIEAIERNLLGELEMRNDAAGVEQAMNDDTIRQLGLVDHFRMRQMISRSEVSHMLKSHDVLHTNDTVEGSAIAEVKEYGPYINPAELPGLAARVALLADLLGTPKSTGFRALKCFHWENRTLEHKFVLYFEVPEGYALGDNNYQTLHSVIRTATSATRPSMDSRMAIALGISKAIQKWHSVGWVHQGINSHNILFFRSKITGELDYHHPFLHGFDFARPNFDRSIGFAMDDIAFNVYRHPSRQGTVRQGHRKIHDLYSLGVVLLEIGLWQTAKSMLNLLKQYEPCEIKELLQSSCSGRLAHYAGVSFQSAVASCLSSEFGVEVDNEKGSGLGRAFELKVIEMIRKGISLT
ncbi:hypothetical protein F4679DRAFT_586334 [Xylaria curta]|nr:hypothetical protein F4679DRAFT_586334 [Xylaria curta]